ncbi:hypothetical protein [Sphingobacterium bovistauri]|uniref:Uncharacterized protein n=1 Tax=Sphingobacterium bovistauri TaxID=2781959 RepID=A0ABS7Z0L9_9SPHI|nr:hypothetical protein [Sphingobacterium bovistauri]MCA5003711.1 hypothetical protein [Sphingobacterium bovistauri]
MKKQIFLAIFVLCSLHVFGQNKKSNKQDEKLIDSASVILSDFDTLAYIDDDSYKDTIRIEAGQKYAVLIDVSDQSIDYDQQTSDLDRESLELENNFSFDDLNVIKISEISCLVFDNGFTIDFDKTNEYEKAIIFWDGLKNNDVFVKYDLIRTTEFISEKLKLNKVSSYVTNTVDNLKKIEEIKKANNFTDNSKGLLESYLNKYIWDFQLFDEYIFFYEYIVNNKSLKNVKSITSNFSLVTDTKYEELISMDEDPNEPMRIVELDYGGIPRSVMKEGDILNKTQGDILSYKGGVLSSVIMRSNGEKSVFYNDNYMMVHMDSSNYEKAEIYWIQDGNIFIDTYLIWKNMNDSYKNIFSTKKIMNDSFANKSVISKTSNHLNSFPLIHTIYEDDNSISPVRIRIEKINNNKYCVFVAKFGDRYFLLGTCYMLNNGLIDKIVFDLFSHKNYVINYSYTYY